jgi:UDP-3-O-[3-hydroxymyristoyl] glucosamine N-acyltransferase
VSVTLRQLAELVRGEVEGDGDLPVLAARPLGEAGPGDITFADERHLDQLHRSHASAAVVPPNATANGKPIIRVHDPLAAFIDIFRRLGRPSNQAPTGIHPNACVASSAVVGPDCWIGPFAVIGEDVILGRGCHIHPGAVIGATCRLGDDVELHPHVVLYDGCVLGNRVSIHANSVIGADGFGYRWIDGRHVKVPQMGHVEIGDDVEIGACSTIDRGTFGATRVGAGTKIDNHVQIAHNCRIDPHNILCAHVAIGGSASTGQRVVLAGQAGVRDHVHIGDGATIGPQAGVTKSIAAGESVMGIPAIPLREFKMGVGLMTRLPQMRQMLRRIVKHLGLDEADA